MCDFQIFLSVDPSIGRVDYSLMSDQTLMELFVDGFDEETKKKYQDNEGMYLDVCQWPQVECDDGERVIEIGADCRYISGSIQLCYVPAKVRALNLKPPWTSKLTGSVDLTCLPEGMQTLRLNDHQLSGEIDLTQLPVRMCNLELKDNQLTGEIDLTHLPGSLSRLFLTSNQLSGKVDLTHLPYGMVYLHLENNQFAGSLVINSLSNGIYINAQGNHFNAVAVVDSEAFAMVNLRGSGVTSVVDENGREIDIKQFLP